MIFQFILTASSLSDPKLVVDSPSFKTKSIWLYCVFIILVQPTGNGNKTASSCDSLKWAHMLNFKMPKK